MAALNLQIFVPTRPRNATRAEAAAAVREAEATLCKLGGGATVTRAEGIWIDPKKVLALRDRIVIIETDASGDEKTLGSELDALARQIGRALRETCIYVRIRPAGNAHEVTIPC